MWEVVDEPLGKRFHGTCAGGGPARMAVSGGPRRLYLMTRVVPFKKNQIDILQPRKLEDLSCRFL
jgi:hypothetical protein